LGFVSRLGQMGNFTLFREVYSPLLKQKSSFDPVWSFNPTYNTYQPFQ